MTRYPGWNVKLGSYILEYCEQRARIEGAAVGVNIKPSQILRSMISEGIAKRERNER
jgi:hypothetical protein